MATNALTAPSNVDMIFGTHGDLSAFARRIRLMCKGGDKLSDVEALALAQFSAVTQLNPFIGEAWYIPGSGPMTGIAGARRLEQQDAASRGGYSTVEFIPVSPDEAGANEAEAKDAVAAFRAEITDSAASLDYQKMFTATLAELRASGIPDPVGVAREICGPRPKWIGYGFSTKSERSRMSKVQLARKRSHADALKKKVILPFGAKVAETDMSPEYIEASAQDIPAEPKRTHEQALSDLGFEEAQFEQAFPPKPAPETINQETGEVTAPVQMYGYLSSEIVETVMKALDYDKKTTCSTIAEAYRSGKIGKSLTIAEAEAFASALLK